MGLQRIKLFAASNQKFNVTSVYLRKVRESNLLTKYPQILTNRFCSSLISVNKLNMIAKKPCFRFIEFLKQAFSFGNMML